MKKNCQAKALAGVNGAKIKEGFQLYLDGIAFGISSGSFPFPPSVREHGEEN
jgi:hypothetical protein